MLYSVKVAARWPWFRSGFTEWFHTL